MTDPARTILLVEDVDKQLRLANGSGARYSIRPKP
jgi:hypothetical protein